MKGERLKGMRWNKGKNFVAVYDYETDMPLMQFEDIWEIVKYKGWERTRSNYNIVLQDLYRACEREDNATRMFGKLMKAFIYAIDDEEDIL